MTYCEIIKSSKMFVVPKSGIYKIICIGGGGAGYAYQSDTILTSSEAGGTTAFGSYISATGGASGKDVISLDGTVNVAAHAAAGFAGGINGFDGACEYGASSDATVGYGYGAGGAALTTNAKTYCSGQAGEVASITVELDKSASIACTIGAGGKAVAKAASSNTAYAWSGKDGAIIIQYLGEMI